MSEDNGAHQDPEPLWREAAGAELRRRRTDAGRTLADVADAAGVSVAYLSEIERGRKEPSSEMLGAVSGALGIGLVDLTSSVAETLTRRPAGEIAAPRAEARAQGQFMLAA
ncbi:transcriptional regulator with XRE-family HTH domain [Naumannella cuiyingiana]|uniref:Transcriptional regulator with XRE-family HTH domain n=1 Tax=Naumannella cuiyingiana TaxID=1347891 RepID=A0A7Z0IKJ9_9ACTN|nr:helix-turn-helix transcriptional regulator [Naumannella cuiyingiana]NYI70593.1 transcriptional regulator with XRE-family HTH domain [Naumannella cuiyingiana]